jgi:hypothetical protein
VSLFLTAHRAHDAGDEELAAEYLNECRTVLEALLAAGFALDAPMLDLHRRLAASEDPESDAGATEP